MKPGDEVNCTISKLQPLKAEAEDIPLDIVYEDQHLLVVNKPPHMVLTCFFQYFLKKIRIFFFKESFGVVFRLFILLLGILTGPLLMAYFTIVVSPALLLIRTKKMMMKKKCFQMTKR